MTNDPAFPVEGMLLYRVHRTTIVEELEEKLHCIMFLYNIHKQRFDPWFVIVNIVIWFHCYAILYTFLQLVWV